MLLFLPASPSAGITGSSCPDDSSFCCWFLGFNSGANAVCVMFIYVHFVCVCEHTCVRAHMYVCPTCCVLVCSLAALILIALQGFGVLHTSAHSPSPFHFFHSPSLALRAVKFPLKAALESSLSRGMASHAVKAAVNQGGIHTRP